MVVLVQFSQDRLDPYCCRNMVLWRGCREEQGGREEGGGGDSSCCAFWLSNQDLLEGASVQCCTGCVCAHDATLQRLLGVADPLVGVSGVAC